MNEREMMQALLDGKTLIDTHPRGDDQLRERVRMHEDKLIFSLNGKQWFECKGFPALYIENVSILEEEEEEDDQVLVLWN